MTLPMEQVGCTVSPDIVQKLGEDTETLLRVEVERDCRRMVDLFGYLQVWDRNLPRKWRFRVSIVGDIITVVNNKPQMLMLLASLHHHRLVRVPNRCDSWLPAWQAAALLRDELLSARWPIMMRPDLEPFSLEEDLCLVGCCFA